MKLFKWTNGRHPSCDYRKLPLAFFRIGKIGFDAYILDYNVGFLPNHKDPIKNGKHYRFNLKLSGNATFWSEKVIFSNKFMAFFRPDLYTHNLTIITKTKKLSVGLVIFKD